MYHFYCPERKISLDLTVKVKKKKKIVQYIIWGVEVIHLTFLAFRLIFLSILVFILVFLSS